MFVFLDSGLPTDDILDLQLKSKNPADSSKGYVPEYVFKILLKDSSEHIGQVKFRIGSEQAVRLAGHVHFSIEPEYRGHKYSVRACRLLFALAKRHNISRIWFACDAENLASQKILSILGATLAETIPTPENTDIYAEGERRTCRYLLDI